MNDAIKFLEDALTKEGTYNEGQAHVASIVTALALAACAERLGELAECVVETPDGTFFATKVHEA